jgi:hypothetical protein
MIKPYNPEKILIEKDETEDGDKIEGGSNNHENDSDLEGGLRAGYSAYDLIDEKPVSSEYIGGGIIYPDALKEKLKELQVPLGLVTRFTPNRINLIKQNGGTEMLDNSIFDKLEKEIFMENTGGKTRKNKDLEPLKKTQRNKKQ